MSQIFVDPSSHEALTFRELGQNHGAWVRSDGKGYPVTNRVARFVAAPSQEWPLEVLGIPPALGGQVQAGDSVASFGMQWQWDSAPRTEQDLRWRVAERFGLAPSDLSGLRVLDAGCGAGAQSAFLARQGATVTSVDLSDAIEVAARLPDLQKASLAQADLLKLPLADASFDLVYCEGVLQHTADAGLVLRELRRVLRPGGRLLATHYTIPRRLVSRARYRLREGIRHATRNTPQEVLFLASGAGAALAQIPVLGWFLKNTIVVANPRMPGLKPTWSATYDTFGTHSYQRFLRHADFLALVKGAGFARTDGTGEDGVVIAS